MEWRPQMAPKEVQRIERELSSRSRADVLEWGTGGSTAYFTRFLRDRGIPYTWTGVEYNKEWFDRLSGELADDPLVILSLFDSGNTSVKQRDLPMDEYVAYPSMLDRRFDVIIVDGRKRRRCLLEAAKLLKPGGVVFLHDARRSHYHSAFRKYPDSRMVLWSGLWEGRLEDPGLLRKVRNALEYGCFRLYVFGLGFRPVRHP